MEENTIKLLNENNEEIIFYVEDEFDFENKHYLVLYEEESSEDSFLFYVEEQGEDLVVKMVEDDEEFERVSDYYDNL